MKSDFSFLSAALTLLLVGYVLVVVSVLWTHESSLALGDIKVVRTGPVIGDSSDQAATAGVVASLRGQLRATQEELSMLRASQILAAANSPLDKGQGPEQQKVIEDRKEDLKLQAIADSHPPAPASASASAPAVVESFTRATHSGVVILGMHRSGTSVVGGLLNRMGLQTGQPLIGPNFDNTKGFFERVDVVLQNDYLMRMQNIHYAAGTYSWDAKKGLSHALQAMHLKEEEEADTEKARKAAERRVKDLRAHNDNYYGLIDPAGAVRSDLFNEGKRALAFLNDKKNFPWMLKDPRLCITLRTWLGLLDHVPAVLFTYRHPMDVALSLNKRDTYRIPRGLKMWYMYNMRAVQNSQDLCRVASSHKAIMLTPEAELQRVYTQLTQHCGVAIPHPLTKEVISEFVDVKLNHAKNTQQDAETCRLLAADANAAVMPPESAWKPNSNAEIELYRVVMHAYCGFEDGSAFLPDFPWKTGMQDN